MDNIMLTFRTLLLLGLFTFASNFIFAQEDGVAHTGQIGKKDLQFVDQQGKIVTYPRMNQFGHLLYYRPIVTTDSVPGSTIGNTQAVIWGNVWHHGWSEPITLQGFQVSPNLFFDNYIDSAYIPRGVGVFHAPIQGLVPNTHYYVRTYAANSQGVSYGDTLAFSTSGLTSLTIIGKIDTSKCPSSDLLLTYIATPDPTGTYTYEWSCSGGTETPSNTDRYSVTYSEVGTYTVTCTAGGRSSTFTTTITEAPLPVVSICVDNYSSTATVQDFQNTETGMWYESGTTTPLDISNPQFFVNVPDNTYVLEAISDQGCKSTEEITISKINTPCTVTSLATNENGSPDGSANYLLNSVTDHQNNSYQVVQIGNQCWMRENMRATTSPSTGNSLLETDTNNYSYTGKKVYAYYPYVSEDDSSRSFILYNWNAAIDTFNTSYTETSVDTDPSHALNVTLSGNRRGICPQGWHVPTDEEWMILESSVGITNSDTLRKIGFRGDVAAKLAGGCEWSWWDLHSSDITPGDYPDSLNSSKFTAIPSGIFDGTRTGAHSLSFDGAFGVAEFWTSTPNISDEIANAYCRMIFYDGQGVYRSNDDIHKGRAVRCLRNTSLIVTTSAVSDVEATTFTCGGEVTYSGSDTVVSGILWGTHPNLTIEDEFEYGKIGIGSFSSIVNCVTPNTTYYVRAVAVSKKDTTVVYGDEISVTTPAFNCGTSSVCDIEGNIYRTVKMGSQCWLRDNIRSTLYADGRSIDGFDDTYYNMINYTWEAAMDNAVSSESNPSGVRGICPEGWHVPSSPEWNQMENFVADSFGVYPDEEGLYIAKLLADTTSLWTESDEENTPGNVPSTNNASGFSIVPSGGDAEIESNRATSVSWLWTATNYGDAPDYRLIEYNTQFMESGYVFSEGEYLYGGDQTIQKMAIRCVRDSVHPNVNTAAVSNIGITTANCGGNVTLSGDAPVIARGVCWSTSPNPTVADNHTIDGSGEGSFTSTITDFTANTKYYIRAYATNRHGTGYGMELEFMTRSTCTVSALGANESGNETRLDSLRDVDNNWYDVVQIGSQCWLKENLRTKRYADNNTISKGVRTTSSLSTAYYYYPQNDSANVASYGLLYNWAAVKGSGDSSATNPSGVQGICPNGWHVPSSAEWAALGTYVSSQSQYRCSSPSTFARAVASMIGWDSSSITCAIGNNLSENNATGLSLMPAGNAFGMFTNIGTFADLWTITSYDSETAESFNLTYSATYLPTCHANSRYMGFSVRCIRD